MSRFSAAERVADTRIGSGAARTGRLARIVGAAALLTVSLALAGCTSGGSTDESANGTTSPSATQTTDAAESTECAGVRVVVEFGELGDEPVDACADTDEAITAAEAFSLAGVELTEGQAYAGSICRVEGEPAAGAELSYEAETYTEECTAMGPVWAYWGLFVDQGDGWAYAQEGASTQLLEPGQGVAFAWQFGDTSEPQLPAV